MSEPEKNSHLQSNHNDLLARAIPTSSLGAVRDNVLSSPPHLLRGKPYGTRLDTESRNRQLRAEGNLWADQHRLDGLVCPEADEAILVASPTNDS